MSEWWTYTLSDFLLFSPKTYYRLFELYHRDIWPGQVVALGLGVVLVVLMRGGRSAHGRIAAAILAVCWGWVAWAFHAQRYATINWAATYFAAAFALEALLLISTGVIRGRLLPAPPGDLFHRAGLALLLFALFVQPLVGRLGGRPWAQAEIFGVTPDPTVVATLGILLAAAHGRVGHLMLIPLLWCAVSGAFLWAMEAPDAIAMPLAGVVVLVLVAVKARRGSAPPSTT